MTKPAKVISLALVIVLASFGLAWLIQSVSHPASTDLSQLSGDDFDRQYMADMLNHHQGAIDIAELAAHQSTNQNILDLAETIAQQQADQHTQMTQWQTAWGYSSTTPASSMAHQMHNMDNQLQHLSGAEFDQEFLRQMIDHHQMAVDMSQYATTRARHQQLKDLASQVIQSQTAEINQMKQLLNQPAESSMQ